MAWFRSQFNGLTYHKIPHSGIKNIKILRDEQAKARLFRDT
jgi:hypothetical protein